MESAKRTLRYYLKTVWEKAGLKWTPDNDAEVDDILQTIFEEAQDRSWVESILRQHGLIV